MEESIQDGISGIVGKVDSVLSNPTATAIGGAVVGAIVGGAIVGAVVSNKKSSGGSTKKTGRKIQHTKRGWKQDRARFNKRQKWEVAYRKRKAKKSKSKRTGKIKYTRKGQPYIILSSGKAKFIKKSKR